jgi:peptidoglycan pentaglycine glycine transferase (the first glycine)
MDVIVCDNTWQEKWDSFTKDNSADFGLLQSWQWGELSKSRGFDIYRIAVVEGEQILSIVQLEKRSLKLGKSYFYIPRGPVITDSKAMADQQADVLDVLFYKIKELATTEKVIFTRMDPAWSDNKELQSILKKSGFKFTGQVQPKQTIILNLKKSEEELLAEMKSKTRYNIRVARKREVTIDEGNQYFDDFWGLMQKTSKRQEITQHSKTYYQKLLDILGKEQIVKLKVAKIGNKIVAANFVVYFGDWCVYLYGASDYEYRGKMAPYLLQWETIKEAMELGYKHYDFWGVDEKQWPGISRFKTGFSPKKEITTYIGSWDKVYSKMWYNLYRLATKLLKR